MKALTRNVITCLAVSLAYLASAQEDETGKNQIVIPFSNDGKRSLEVHLMQGGITVEGYEGSEVIATVDEEDMSFNEDNLVDEEGLRLIGMPSTSLYAEEENNHVRIGSNKMGKEVNLTIRVPFHTDLKLQCMHNGDIEVSGVTGLLELNNLNGEIDLENVSGTVLAHALNGDIEATILELDRETPMSITSLNGDIDLSLKPDVNANLRMQTFQGEIRSNFDIDVNPGRMQQKGPSAEANPSDKESRLRSVAEEISRRREERRNSIPIRNFQLQFESVIEGKLNAGGPQIILNTHNGDIRIRKLDNSVSSEHTKESE